MKVKRSFTKSLSGLVGLGGLAGLLLSGPTAWSAAADGVARGFEGEFSYYLCPQDRPVDVLDESLAGIAFSVTSPKHVKLMQGFGGDDTKNVNGTIYRRVQITGQPVGMSSGFVDEESLTPKSKCASALAQEQAEQGEFSADVLDAQAADLAGLGSLPSWTFPTIKRPADDYKGGMRRFGASRAAGRKHAACDLYRLKGEAAVSVAAGKVIRARYAFYEGTYAIEVQHEGGKVVRYGEILGKSASGTSKGARVKTGQTIGYIAKVNSGCCEPMLHFEMYTGKLRGALSQRNGTKYQRRKDLMDPSAILTQLEKQKFGESW